MNGFRLTLAPRIMWTDMTRDLVASGAARSGLSVDRFSDLLLLTEQVASDFLAGEGPVVVALTAESGAVEVTFESFADRPGELSRFAIESLADRHWSEPTPTGQITGYAFVV